MNKRIIIISLIVIGIIATTFFYFFKQPSEKTGYIEINKIFADFKLKKELEVQLTKVKESRKVIMDSLEFGLKVLSKQIQADGQKDKDKIALFEVKREEYLQKKKQFEDDNDAVAKQYDSQIISQMNQYVKDYGNKNGYTYIFGADGSGFLMFSSETKNITEEVKNYINDRYKGKVE
ncbi:MAG: hypothetical protein A3F72_01620 [Bacteroidetes bacterium RIFCSPLOWO2_12_FULL_35_15]|nr:MAG: hypothetical protein A3F72_01620 [Bacteroidetes bacterium RIFCSPLOWO2_12_FULL_35_15]